MMKAGNKPGVIIASCLAVALAAGIPVAASAVSTENGSEGASEISLIEDASVAYSSEYMSSEFYRALKAVSLTGNYRQDIVNVALSQVGYHEGSYSTDIDGYSTGASNYTEYGRRYNVNGIAWCSTFAMWVIREAGVPESIVKTCTAAQPSSFGAPNYRWSETVYAGGSYLPQAGDLAMFAWGDSYNPDWLDHTTIVMSSELVGDTVHMEVVHGNSSEAVVTTEYEIDPSSGRVKGSEKRLVAFVAPEYGDAAPVSQSLGVSKLPSPSVNMSSLAFLFDDVNSGDWFVTDGSLDYVYSNNLMTGYEGENRFGTLDPITCAQLANILYRHEYPAGYLGASIYNDTDAWDVEDRAWYTPAINWAVSMGIVEVGTDSDGDAYLGVDDPLSREKFAHILANYAQYRGHDTTLGVSSLSFYNMEDYWDVSEWAWNDLIWCTHYGIMNGSANDDGTTTLDPQRSINRAEAAKMLRVTLSSVLAGF